MSQQALRPTARDAGIKLAPTPDDETFRQIFALLRRRTGHDFGGYKISTVRLRVERRMRVHQLETLAEYECALRSNPHELDVLSRELMISATSFFRDREPFKALSAALAKLASHPLDRPLRVWVPGCATGEEPYSIAMILTELAEELHTTVRWQIFGTDLDVRAIEIARAGRYPRGIAADVGRKRLARFFDSEGNFYRIKKEIREVMVFAPQNAVSDPPFTKLDLISCRNLLIYLVPQVQQQLLSLFHYALAPRGLLLLGTSESAEDLRESFEPIDRKWKLYQRTQIVSRPVRAWCVPDARHLGTMRSSPRSRASGGTSSLVSLLERFLLDHFALPTVIVNAEGNILYIHGSTGAYLEPSAGEPTNDIFSMARDGLRLALASALRQASTKAGEFVRKAVVGTNHDRASVNLRVHRIDDPEALRGLFRISFEAIPGDPRAKPIRGQLQDRSGLDLRQELEQTHDTLQDAVEAMQTSHEELNSSNEELQATNEELQSTNEELETSKQELQALNDELQTVNAQLRTKIAEAARANDDMQNLLDNTAIATLFLDRDLNIKRFTSQVSEIVRLIPSDIGRPIGDLASHLHYDQLTVDARRVLDTLVPRELEIQTASGEWRLLRMLPYRTSQNRIDGVVVTMVDINRVKRAELLASSRAFAESIVQTVREPLVVLDFDFRVVAANRAFFRSFHLEPRQVEKQVLFDIDSGLLAIPRLRALLAQVVAGCAPLHDTRVEHDFATTGRRCLVVNARLLEGDAASAGQILLALGDPAPSAGPN